MQQPLYPLRPPLHLHHGCRTKCKRALFTKMTYMYDMQTWLWAESPRRGAKKPGVEEGGETTQATNLLLRSTEGFVLTGKKQQTRAHTQKKASVGIKLWSKYRFRITVSLWSGIHRMGDTLQYTEAEDYRFTCRDAWTTTRKAKNTVHTHIYK